MPTESEKLANDPPVERGWYWVDTNPAWCDAPEVVFIGFPEYDDRLHVFSIGGTILLQEYCEKFPRKWLGKVEYPESYVPRT